MYNEIFIRQCRVLLDFEIRKMQSLKSVSNIHGIRIYMTSRQKNEQKGKPDERQMYVLFPTQIYKLAWKEKARCLAICPRGIIFTICSDCIWHTMCQILC